MTFTLDLPPLHEDSPPPPPRRDPRRTGRTTPLTVFAELLVTLGVVALLFVVYEVYYTNWVSQREQTQATQQMEQAWASNPRGELVDLEDGKGFAKMYIPAFGPDYHFTILEGTGEDTLVRGPGHYKDTAYPGKPGNFAVAGHRVGKGAPFNDLDLLNSCDAIVVETKTNWYVYRVLPMRTERKGWLAAKGSQPRCAGVKPMTGAYSSVSGRVIVDPTQGEVIAPIPGDVDSTVDADSPKLITLTTCHPKFSNRQRLIIHGIMVKKYAKPVNGTTFVPPEMREGDV